jgi:hypothetical protein
MGFAIAGAMGQDEVAVGTALNQGFKAGKENAAKERAYREGAHKHGIARAYNDMKDKEIKKITQEYLANEKNAGKTSAQQAEEIDKIFNDRVMALFSGEATAESKEQSKLLSKMKDYGTFLAAQGKDRDSQYDELEKIIDGIDSGNIGELWSGDDAAGFGVIPTYQLGEINKGAGRSHKTIIKETIDGARDGNGNLNVSQAVDAMDGGVIRRDEAIERAKEEASDAEFFKSIGIEDGKKGKGK